MHHQKWNMMEIFKDLYLQGSPWYQENFYLWNTDFSDIFCKYWNGVITQPALFDIDSSIEFRSPSLMWESCNIKIQKHKSRFCVLPILE